MTIDEIKAILLWCIAINYAILFAWFGVFVFAHDWLYRVHTQWFKLAVQTFDAIHYAGIGIYKVGILLLNLVPLVALVILTSAARAAGT